MRLFNPRADSWEDHFEWHGPELHGKTNIALATLELLRINTDRRVSHRSMLIEAGLFPAPVEG